MHLRSVLSLCLLSSLAACTYSSLPTDPNNDVESDQKAATDKKKGTDKAGEAADESERANASVIDGTWDITTSGTTPVESSEMTIKGNDISGIVMSTENTSEDDTDCGTIAHSRVKFAMKITGDTLAGSFTVDRLFAGANCEPSKAEVVAITGTRAHAAANANGQTVAEGDWQIRIDGNQPFAVSIAGLVAKAFDGSRKTGTPVVTTTVANDEAITSSKDRYFTFAARKR